MVHKESEILKNNGTTTAELRTDIEAMEKEKEIVIKRIEKMQRRVCFFDNLKDMVLVPSSTFMKIAG